MNQKREQDGEHLKIEEMYKKYPDKFFEYTRMTPSFFDKLFGLVGPALAKNDTNFRNCIPAKTRLYVILR